MQQAGGMSLLPHGHHCLLEMAELQCIRHRPDVQAYNGYNLVVGDLVTKEVAYLTNRGGPPGVISLNPGVHGLSNGVMGQPYWTKVRQACL